MDDELVPILRVRDAAATARWYSRLGFELLDFHRLEPHLPAYAFLRRGGVHLHLSEHKGDAPKQGVVYYYVDRETLSALASEFGVSPESQPWGDEIQLVDPDRNRVRIGFVQRDTVQDDRTGDERTILTSMLDFYRRAVVEKVTGLSDEQAARRLVASESTVAGIIKHLALVEDAWFVENVSAAPIPAPWDSIDWDSDPDWEFRTGAADGLRHVLALYAAACARSRAVVKTKRLDDLIHKPNDPDRKMSVRWVLVHMIEETARHAGHLDILCELLGHPA